MKKQILTLAAVTILLLLGSGSKASAALQLKLTDNLGNSVTVTDNGSGDNDSTVGSINFTGAVGPNWYLNVVGGTSKPVTGSASAPGLDISTLNFSSGAGTLDIQLSDTDFTTASPVTYLASIGGTTPGSVTFTNWADGANGPFAETTLLTSQGPYSGASGFSGNQSVVQSPGGSPYSLTLDTTITHSAAGNSSFDANLAGISSPTANCVTINAVQNVPITSVTLVASGGTGSGYTFTATGLPAGLSISTGGTISGTPTVSGPFTYKVTITDSAGNTGTLNCSVTVNPPPVTASCVAINNAVQGVAITSVTLTGSGGCGGPYKFSATSASGLPAGLSISSNGTISGTPTVSGTFGYSITITDSCGNTGTLACSVPVNPPPSASCVTINAVQGVAIRLAQMTASGGCGGPYTFLATGLPAGVTMDFKGNISGTPTVSGTFNYIVTIMDNCGNTGTSGCNPSPCTTTWNFTTPSGCLGVASHPYSAGGLTITATAYGIDSKGNAAMLYGKNAGGTETGLGICDDAQQNEITTANFVQLDLSDLINKGAKNAQILINSVQSGEGYKIYGSSTPGTLGTLLASGGAPANTFFAIPNYPNDRFISVQASAANVLLGAVSVDCPCVCTITIAPPPSANCVTINAVQNVAITPVTLVASGGTGSGYTFTATGLPANLIISTGGTISGTPTVNGTFTYKVMVKDSAGNPGTFNCSVKVLTSPSANCVTINAVQNVAITPVTLTGTGGTGSGYTFTATGLPAGLSISTSGTISGTPTVNGTFTYTVTVKDSAGNTGTVNCGVVSSVPPCQASVCGFVFTDCNGDGFLTPGIDIGMPKVVVTLKNSKGVTVATATTGADGSYCFTGLAAGTYTASIAQPTGCIQTAGTHNNHWLNNSYQQCWTENDGYQHCKGGDGVDRWTAKDGYQHWKNSNNQDCWKDKYGYSHTQNCTYVSCDVPKGNCETFTLVCGQALTGVNFTYQGISAQCVVSVTGPSKGVCGKTGTYSCSVRNTGTACYTACKVTVCGKSYNCPALSPGQSCSFTFNYQFQYGDYGSFNCKATASCTPAYTTSNNSNNSNYYNVLKYSGFNYSNTSSSCTAQGSCNTSVGYW